MGLLTNALAAIAASIIGRQIYDLGPGVSAWIIKCAAKRLPRNEQDRRQEEWLAHLNEMPGLAGLYHANGALIASFRIKAPFETAISRLSLQVMLAFVAHLYVTRGFAPALKELQVLREITPPEKLANIVDRMTKANVLYGDFQKLAKQVGRMDVSFKEVREIFWIVWNVYKFSRAGFR